MLTKEDIKWSLQFLKLVSALGFLPLDINVETPSIRVTQGFRIYIYPIFCGLTVIHLCFLLWKYWLFYANPELLEKVFDDILFLSKVKHKGTSRWKGYSFEDILVVGAPMVASCWFFILILFLKKPTRLSYFSSVLDVKFTSSSSYILWGGLELFLWSSPISVEMLVLFYAALFFKTTSQSLKSAEEMLNCREHITARTINSCEHALRRLQLLLLYFNQLYSHIIFSLKNFYICGGITCGYPAVALRHISLLDSTVFTVFGVETVLIYVLIFNRAFGFGCKMIELKKDILVASQLIPRKTWRMEVERRTM
ncbi:unnamed protein product [Allacma fusca]|uniref:Uncharacterized protein n=1 Tax=Allacma fusca TaxID=39272 RepID=A0A8J2NZN4_9HEXA|nr:unnamed protein product [Allacma fusca]